MGRRAAYAEATKRELVEVARRLFTARGYSHTSIDDVVEEAGVTKGALYHHFDNKLELFAAVAEQVEADLTARIARGPVGVQEPWDALLSGIERYLDECMNPEVERILLLEAPTVLGWERWRDLEARYGLGLTIVALELAMEAGALRRQDPEPLAHLLLGALGEGATYIVRAKSRKNARKEIGEALRAMLEGLRT